MVKRRLIQFNQNIHIAFRSGIPFGKGTEYTDSFDRKPDGKSIAIFTNSANYFIFSIFRFLHRCVSRDVCKS